MPTYADDGETITGVTPQTDFTGDANEKTGIEVTDANGTNCNNAMPIDGSVLYVGKTSNANWRKNFSSEITTGKVYYACNYRVGSNNSQLIRIVGNDDKVIYGSATNNTGNNANQTVATICGETITGYCRQPRKCNYGVKSLCIDLDLRKVEYTLLVSSGNNSYTTLTGTVDLPEDITSVKGLYAVTSSYDDQVYMDGVMLYSVVSSECTVLTEYVDENGNRIFDDVETIINRGESFTPTYVETYNPGFYTYTYKEGGDKIATVNSSQVVTIVYTKTLKDAYTAYTLGGEGNAAFMEDYIASTATNSTTSTAGRYDPIIAFSDNNHYLTVNQNNRNNNGATVTSGIINGKVAANTDFTLCFDLQLTAAKDRTTDITTFTINDAANAAAILSFTASATGSTTWKINGSDDVTATLVAGTWYSVKVTRSADITYCTITKKSDGTNVLLKEEISKLSETGGLGNMVLATARINANLAIDNVMVRDVVESEDIPAAATTYTIKYVKEDGTAITGKDDVVIETYANESVTATEAQMATFELNGKKYVYKEGNETITIVADAESNVITLVFYEYSKWNYTVTTSYDGNTLPYEATGSVWENDNKVYVQYPRYQLFGTQLVERVPRNNELNAQITVANDDYTTDFDYNIVEGKDNIYLLSEAEDLEGTGLSTNATSFTKRVSGGYIIYGSSANLLSLPAGKYIVTVGVIGGDNNTHKVNYVFYQGDKDSNSKVQIGAGTCTGNMLYNITCDEINISETTTISMTCSDPSSSRGIDLVYVQKTGDVELPGDNTELLALITTATGKAADEEAVAVGKLTDAIAAAQAVADNNEATASQIADAMTALQAAIDQFDADNTDQSLDMTDKVGLAQTNWDGAGGTAGSVTTYLGTATPLAELYSSSSAGIKMQQTISGLENGHYDVKVFATSHNARGEDGAALDGTADDVAYVFATSGETTNKTWITARGVAPDFVEGEQTTPVAIDRITVSNGSLTIGLALDQAQKTGWHTIQIYQLTWVTTAKEVWAKAKSDLQVVIDAAELLVAETYKTKNRDVLNAAIDAAKAAKASNKLNVSEVAAAKATLQAAMEAFRVANYAEIAEGAIYLKNVGTGKYLAAGADWGSRAIVNETGLDYTSTLSDGKYTLDSKVSNGGDKHFLNNGLFNDGVAYSWVFEQVGADCYTIGDGGTNYLTVDGNNLVQFTTTVNDNAKWQVVTRAERIAAMADATAENPVDVTFLIKDANFNRNDTRVSAWTFTKIADGIEPGNNMSGGNNVNNCAEAYHRAFTLSQMLSDVPNGYYSLTAQGFYRKDEGATDDVPYFFINNGKGNFPEKTGEEGNMSAASESFTAGNYTISPIDVTVADHTITLGAKLESNTALWVIFDNFRLTYKGKLDLSEFIAAYQTALANAKTAAAKEDRMSAAVKAAIDAAIDTYDTGKVNEEEQDELEAAINALTTATNNVNTSINSYKILAAGTIADNSLEGWTCENNNAFHINDWSTEGNSDGTGMTTPFIENWVGKPGPLGTGNVYYTLPFVDPGTYKVSALVRIYSESGAEPSGASWFVGEKESNVTEGTSFTYNDMKGIYKNYVTIGEPDAQGTLKFGIKIDESRTFNWIAFKSVRIQEVTVATPEDYTALNAAIEAKKEDGKTLGFDEGEYAPYTNIEVIDALAAARAIDQNDDNDQTTVQAATNALTNATWTQNTEELNAIYDGDFNIQDAHTTGPTALAGWTNIDGIRQLIKDTATDPGLVYASKNAAVFSWGGTTMTYGESNLYALPLNKHSIYELSFKITGWRDGDKPSYVSATLDNDTKSTGVTVEKKINDNDGDPFVTVKFFLEPTEDNSVLKIYANHHYVITDIVLKKAVAENITIAETADYTPTERYGNVTFNRTLVAGWNGLVLPFDMTVTGIKNKFSATKVKNFTGISYVEAKGVTLNFADFDSETTVIPAGTPFLVKVKADAAGSSYTIDNVVLPATGLQNITKTAENNDKIKYTMKGTHAASTDLTKVSFALIQGNTFFYHDGAAAKASSAKAFRAYFENESEEPAAARVSFDFGDGETTGITELAQPKTAADGTYYDLQGRKVENFKQKGIYIVNGRKVVK